MLEKKLIGAIRDGILAIGLAAAISGCDNCDNPGTQRYIPAQEGLGVGMSYGNGAILDETADHQYMLMLECPDGCTYDSDVGCCWCPD
jgi:hypothetical protein